MASLGTLFLVATPIGNLDDLPPRAVDVLRDVDLVAAEDTRHSGRLLARVGLNKRLVSCHEHNEERRAQDIVERLRRGEDVALISDAGSPGISDPGYRVVRAAVDADADVVAIPGPCAALLALQISGLPTDTFTFVGFAPKRAGKRRAFLQTALDAPGTVVGYVPARDTASLLDELCSIAGAPPSVAVARELTKIHEEVLRGPADAVADTIRRRATEGGVWKGEVTFVFEAPRATPTDWSEDRLRALLRTELATGVRGTEAVKTVRARSGVQRARLYAMLESIKHERVAGEGAKYGDPKQGED